MNLSRLSLFLIKLGRIRRAIFPFFPLKAFVVKINPCRFINIIKYLIADIFYEYSQLSSKEPPEVSFLLMLWNFACLKFWWLLFLVHMTTLGSPSGSKRDCSVVWSCMVCHCFLVWLRYLMFEPDNTGKLCSWQEFQQIQIAARFYSDQIFYIFICWYKIVCYADLPWRSCLFLHVFFKIL